MTGTRRTDNMHNSVVLLVCCCLGAASIADAAVKLASFVTPCNLKDPKLDDCLTTQGKAILPHIVTGIKDWGVPPMNPLLVPHMQLQRNDGSSLGISISVKNSSQFGWDGMQIQSIKMDPKNYKFDVSWKFPTYMMLGEGVTSGRIILLPISGTGAANITFLDVNTDMTVKCTPEEKKGKTYLKVTDTKVNFKVKKMIMTLDNLFGNKELSDTMNRVLNDNSMDIFEELRNNIEEIFADILSTVLNRMFSKIPLNQMFGDVELKTGSST